MVQETDFPPACPIPLVIQPHERIEWLKERLNEPKNQRQRTNLMTLIRMYETGELGPLTPGHTIYICDGKILNEPLSSENIPSGVTAIWAEFVSSQMLSGSLGFLAGNSMHEIFARFRLISAFGGIPDLFIFRRIANDRGSNIRTIFVSDLAQLQYNPLPYLGNLGQVHISTASQRVTRDQIIIEVQIVNPQGEALTSWFFEAAVVTPDQPGLVRLSGKGMRNHLFFATVPGNHMLYVAKKKNGIVSQLPVV